MKDVFKKPGGTAAAWLGASLLVLGVGTASAQGLPSVPAEIAKAREIRVGVKCDYPPEGFLDSSGQPDGVEVSMAHQLAIHAFGAGSKAKITCVTTANRVPSLLGGKIDVIIATLGITPARAEVVAFTQPYAWSSQGVLVRANLPYKTVAELNGKAVAFVKGALAITYFEANYPAIKKLQLDGVSDALQALMANRVEGYAHDTPVLLSLARHNQRVRLLDTQFDITLRAAAVRPGDKDLLAFVNASLSRMASEELFRRWLEKYNAGDPDLEVKLMFWDLSKKPDATKQSGGNP